MDLLRRGIGCEAELLGGRFSCREDEGTRHGGVAMGGNHAAHQRDQLRREQRIPRAIIDPVRDFLFPPDLDESRGLQFVRKDTLREGSGDSAGPRRRIGQDLGRQVVVDNDVGGRKTAPGAQHPMNLREHTGLPGGQVHDAV